MSRVLTTFAVTVAVIGIFGVGIAGATQYPAIDIGGHALIIDPSDAQLAAAGYTGFTSAAGFVFTPIEQYADQVVYPWLVAGYNGGAWDGNLGTTGIYSSYVAGITGSHMDYALGMVINADLATQHVPTYTTFGGVDLSTLAGGTDNAILIKPVSVGDLDLDGRVGFNDAVMLNNDYSATGYDGNNLPLSWQWMAGDAYGETQIQFDDAQALNGAYGFSDPGTIVYDPLYGSGAGSGAAPAFTAGSSSSMPSVPEPSTIVLLLAAGAALAFGLIRKAVYAKGGRLMTKTLLMLAIGTMILGGLATVANAEFIVDMRPDTASIAKINADYGAGSVTLLTSSTTAYNSLQFSAAALSRMGTAGGDTIGFDVYAFTTGTTTDFTNCKVQAVMGGFFASGYNTTTNSFDMTQTGLVHGMIQNAAQLGGGTSAQNGGVGSTSGTGNYQDPHGTGNTFLWGSTTYPGTWFYSPNLSPNMPLLNGQTWGAYLSPTGTGGVEIGTVSFQVTSGVINSGTATAVGFWPTNGTAGVRPATASAWPDSGNQFVGYITASKKIYLSDTTGDGITNATFWDPVDGLTTHPTNYFESIPTLLTMVSGAASFNFISPVNIGTGSLDTPITNSPPTTAGDTGVWQWNVGRVFNGGGTASLTFYVTNTSATVDGTASVSQAGYVTASNTGITLTAGNTSAIQTMTVTGPGGATGWSSYGTGNALGLATNGSSMSYIEAIADFVDKRTVTAGNVDFGRFMYGTSPGTGVALATTGTSGDKTSVTVGGHLFNSATSTGTYTFTLTNGTYSLGNVGGSPGLAVTPEGIGDTGYAPVSFTYAGTAVGNRQVFASAITLGNVNSRFMSSQSVGGVSNLTTTGDDSSNTRITVAGAPFNSAGSTGSYNLAATIYSPGYVSGSVSLPITGEQLTGESTAAYPVTVNYSGYSVQNRQVFASAITLGNVNSRFMSSQSVGGVSNLTTTGDDSSKTRITVAGAPFNSAGSTGSYNLTATTYSPGYVSGSVNLPITGEQLTGENTAQYPVTVNYSGYSVQNRAVVATGVDLGRFVSTGDVGGVSNLATTGDDSSNTRITVNGYAFNSPTSTGSYTLTVPGGTYTPGTVNNSVTLPIVAEGLTGENTGAHPVTVLYWGTALTQRTFGTTAPDVTPSGHYLLNAVVNASTTITSNNGASFVTNPTVNGVSPSGTTYSGVQVSGQATSYGLNTLPIALDIVKEGVPNEVGYTAPTLNLVLSDVGLATAGSNGNFGGKLTADLTVANNNVSLAGLASQTTNGLQGNATFLAGTVSQDTTVGMEWMQRTNSLFASDILKVSGIKDGDLYVVEMSYNGSMFDNDNQLYQQSLVDSHILGLSELTGGGWTFAGTAGDSMGAWDDSFADGMTAGEWGVDTTNHVAWAVFDHDDVTLTVVPEPGMLALLAVAGLAGGLVLVRRRRMK